MSKITRTKIWKKNINPVAYMSKLASGIAHRAISVEFVEGLAAKTDGDKIWIGVKDLPRKIVAKVAIALIHHEAGHLRFHFRLKDLMSIQETWKGKLTPKMVHSAYNIASDLVVDYNIGQNYSTYSKFHGLVIEYGYKNRPFISDKDNKVTRLLEAVLQLTLGKRLKLENCALPSDIFSKVEWGIVKYCESLYNSMDLTPHTEDALRVANKVLKIIWDFAKHNKLPPEPPQPPTPQPPQPPQEGESGEEEEEGESGNQPQEDQEDSDKPESDSDGSENSEDSDKSDESEDSQEGQGGESEDSEDSDESEDPESDAGNSPSQDDNSDESEDSDESDGSGNSDSDESDEDSEGSDSNTDGGDEGEDCDSNSDSEGESSEKGESGEESTQSEGSSGSEPSIPDYDQDPDECDYDSEEDHICEESQKSDPIDEIDEREVSEDICDLSGRRHALGIPIPEMKQRRKKSPSEYYNTDYRANQDRLCAEIGGYIFTALREILSVGVVRKKASRHGKFSCKRGVKAVSSPSYRNYHDSRKISTSTNRSVVIYLVVDTSISMAGWSNMIPAYLGGFCEGLQRLGIRFGIIQHSDKTDHVKYPSDVYEPERDKWIKSDWGSTLIWPALALAAEEISKEPEPVKIVISLTDGASLGIKMRYIKRIKSFYAVNRIPLKVIGFGGFRKGNNVEQILGKDVIALKSPAEIIPALSALLKAEIRRFLDR